MNKKPESQLTEGSTYRIISIGAKDSALETEGVFKGFATLGIDEVGLLMELGKKHGKMEGKIRIVPLHAILAIDIIDAKPNQKKDDGKETSRYFG
ncbi:MAG: hypothetical protein DRN08_00345 [Thermoplasmata archaeon]|nr:MAG: hypothetical protein DRN05_03495 [Thermoplasmata archaeon]RLF36968.1 MAG: hypothetical protein DRN08_00345 [Thermoplasmata archaeon]